MLVKDSTGRLTYSVYSAGILTDPASVELMVYDQSGSKIWESAKTPTRLDTGVYFYDLTPSDLDTCGRYKAVWTSVIDASTLSDAEYVDVNMKSGAWTNPYAVRRALTPDGTAFTDDEIQSYIDAAQETIQAATGLNYGQFYGTLTYDGNGQRVLFIPPADVNGRINSISLIEIDDDNDGAYTALDANEYIVNADECSIETWTTYAQHLGAWPNGANSVKITGDFGIDPPEMAQRCVAILAARNILGDSQTRHEKERDLDLADQGYDGASPANTSEPTGVPEVDKLIAMMKTKRRPGVYSV